MLWQRSDGRGCLGSLSSPKHGNRYRIVEEYADSNAAFLADFFPTFEKMLRNGYGPTYLGTASSPACTSSRAVLCVR